MHSQRQAKCRANGKHQTLDNTAFPRTTTGCKCYKIGQISRHSRIWAAALLTNPTFPHQCTHRSLSNLAETRRHSTRTGSPAGLPKSTIKLVHPSTRARSHKAGQILKSSSPLGARESDTGERHGRARQNPNRPNRGPKRATPETNQAKSQAEAEQQIRIDRAPAGQPAAGPSNPTTIPSTQPTSCPHPDPP